MPKASPTSWPLPQAKGFPWSPSATSYPKAEEVDRTGADQESTDPGRDSGHRRTGAQGRGEPSTPRCTDTASSPPPRPRARYNTHRRRSPQSRRRPPSPGPPHRHPPTTHIPSKLVTTPTTATRSTTAATSEHHEERRGACNRLPMQIRPENWSTPAGAPDPATQGRMRWPEQEQGRNPVPARGGRIERPTAIGAPTNSRSGGWSSSRSRIAEKTDPGQHRRPHQAPWRASSRGGRRRREGVGEGLEAATMGAGATGRTG